MNDDDRIFMTILAGATCFLLTCIAINLSRIVSAIEQIRPATINLNGGQSVISVSSNDLPDSPSSYPIIDTLQGDVDTVPEDGK